jgi:hypothetical protein
MPLFIYINMRDTPHKQIFESCLQENAKMHQPGIEPRANAWEAFMLPLHHWCLQLQDIHATF